ncbi:2-phospho-L-lactate guanylyltransferase CofC, partial [Haloferax sp. BAB-2207]
MRVVVPFGGRDPKTRLAPFFDADERREFAVSMLRDVLDAVRAVGGDP